VRLRPLRSDVFINWKLNWY